MSFVNKNKAWVILSLVFLVDTICENYQSWVFGEKAPDWETAYWQANLFCKAESFFKWIPYILPLIFSRFKIKLDSIDELLCGYLLFTCIVDSADYVMNFNWREPYMDWIVFGVVYVTLLNIKIKNHRISLNKNH